MSLLEGVGDEVTVLLLLVLLLGVLGIAWLSTNVQDRSTVNVIVVDRQGFQRLLQRISNLAGRAIQIPTDSVLNRAADNVGSPEASESVEDIASETDQSQTSGNAEATLISPENGGQSTSVRDAPVIEGVGSVGPQASSSDNSSAQHTEGPGQVEPPTSDTRAVPEPHLLSQELLRKSRLAFFQKLNNRDNTVDVLGSDEAERPLSGDGSASPDDSCSEATAQAISLPPAQECIEPEEEECLEGHIRIRLKYLNDEQRLVQAKPQDTVGEFKMRHFASELAENLIVRCIFNGQELRPDSTTLQSYNISDQSIIHCLSQQRPAPEPSNAPEREEWDIGSLMFPLFGIILLLIWYCRFTYRTYFNAMSTFSLIGITLMYVVAILATWRTHEPHPHQD